MSPERSRTGFQLKPEPDEHGSTVYNPFCTRRPSDSIKDEEK